MVGIYKISAKYLIETFGLVHKPNYYYFII